MHLPQFNAVSVALVKEVNTPALIPVNMVYATLHKLLHEIELK